MSPRSLTETDLAEWADFSRRIAPLRGRPRPAAQDTPAPPAMPPSRPKPQVISRTAHIQGVRVAIGDQPGGLDSATWHRFRSGRLSATRKLDLHGLTTQHAFHALTAFLRAAHAERLRCVEIVTGRGSGETGGAIRREFPHWLNLPEVRPLVLAASHPHPANPGSVRLLLRRHR
ncbi:MAG TPA: Smr/MutS family protein [Acetobacteraceae bacterium]